MDNYSSSDEYKVLKFLNSFLLSLYSIILIETNDFGEKTIFPLWVWVFFIYYIISDQTGIYKTNNARRIIGRFIESWIYSLSALLGILYLAKVSSEISRIGAVTWVAVGFLSTLTTHILFYRRNNFKKPTAVDSCKQLLIWGNENFYGEIMRELLSNMVNQDKLSWFGEVNYEKRLLQKNVHYKGNLEKLETWIDMNSPDKIIFSQEEESRNTMKRLIEIFGRSSAKVYYYPSWSDETMSLKTEGDGSSSMIRLWGTERGKIDEGLKRILDIVLSTVFIVVGSPILVLTSILVKMTSKGPIFFTQKRNGLNGVEFDMYKFRSMYLHDSSQSIKQASLNDSRITFIGKFMRKWSIDELPQLFNVLKGDMTIVGPRPHAVQHNNEYRYLISGYNQRHSVKPGMTGLAQVSGYRGETKELIDMKNRVCADLIYQSNWSVKNDLGILVETILALGTKKSY